MREGVDSGLDDDGLVELFEEVGGGVVDLADLEILAIACVPDVLGGDRTDQRSPGVTRIAAVRLLPTESLGLLLPEVSLLLGGFVRE